MTVGSLFLAICRINHWTVAQIRALPSFFANSLVKKKYNIVQTKTRITVSYSCRVCHSCPDLAANCVTTRHWPMNSIHKATVRECWCGLGPSRSKGSNQMHRAAVYTAQTPSVSCCSILTEPRLHSPEVPSHDNLCELLAGRKLFNPLLHLTRVNITELVVMDPPPQNPEIPEWTAQA